MAGTKRELAMDRVGWAILSLLRAPGVGPASVHRILAACEAAGMTVSEAVQTPARALAERLPGVAAQVASCTKQHQREARALIEAVERRGGRLITLMDPAWPRGLNCLGNAMPPVLFLRGDAGLLGEAGAAVVGAREPHKRGVMLASDCGRFFAQEGIVVVSGGARGIDSVAHSATLESGGRTIVVLPQGVLTYGMPEDIVRGVEEGRALVVSQFSPDASWETHGAVTRNATISGLSRMVCVVDPRKTGGSIRAARVAIGQRKPVAAWCSSGAVGRVLETAGAGALADGDGRLRAEYLRELWCQSRREAPVQADLFLHGTRT